MHTFIQDLRYGFRMLRKSPGFTAIAVLMLALGIGGNTAMFSIIDAFAMRPLAVEHPEQIVRISNLKITGGYDSGGESSWPEYEEFRAGSRALSGIAASDRRGALLREGENVRLLLANVTSANYFDVFRLQPAVGRVYAEAELSRPDAPHEVMFSYEFWKSHFNGDRSIVGKPLVLSGMECVVLGVLPSGFRGTESIINPEVYIPLPTWNAMGSGGDYARRDYRGMELFGRLRPQATAAQAQAELTAIQKHLAEAFPKTDSDRRIVIKLDSEVRHKNARGIGIVLFGIAGFVLLIACANVTNLLLARSEVRRREIATRLALGATRGRLVRQSLTESMLLALLAAAFAFLFAGWLLDLIPALMPPLPFSGIGLDVRLDARVLTFAVLASLLAVFIAGVFPAFSTSRVSVARTMKEQPAAEGGRRGYLRNGLVIGEVAISAMLLIGAGLLVRTLVAVRGRDLGFDSHRKMLIVDFEGGQQGTAQDRALHREMLRRLPGLPGVQGVAIASRIPMWGSGGGANKLVWVPGLQQSSPGEDGVHVGFATVSPGYFSTIGTRILRGRAITEQDNELSTPVAVVNETTARMLWPGEDAIGHHFKIGGPQGKDLEVIGVAQDGQYSDINEKQRAYMFVPMFQEGYGDAVLMISTTADPRALTASVRSELHSMNKAAVLSAITMDEHMRFALFEERIQAQLVTGFGVLGLILAAVGLYGVVSYSVSRRTHEIGVRLAVGARPGNVFSLILKRGLVLAGAGIGVGCALAMILSRYLATLLYGVGPRDPLTFGVVVVVLIVVAMLASFVPARRATKVDPMIALRYE